MTTRKRVYVHQDTGNIIKATPAQARFLSSDYKRVTYHRNENGEPVMRLPLRNAVADITENEKEVTDGNRNAE